MPLSEALPPEMLLIFGDHLTWEYLQFSARDRYLSKQIGDDERCWLCLLRLFTYVYTSSLSGPRCEEGMLYNKSASPRSLLCPSLRAPIVHATITVWTYLSIWRLLSSFEAEPTARGEAGGSLRKGCRVEALHRRGGRRPAAHGPRAAGDRTVALRGDGRPALPARGGGARQGGRRRPRPCPEKERRGRSGLIGGGKEVGGDDLERQHRGRHTGRSGQGSHRDGCAAPGKQQRARRILRTPLRTPRMACASLWMMACANVLFGFLDRLHV